MDTHAISPHIFQTRVSLLSLRRTHFLTCGISAATLVCILCTQRTYKKHVLVKLIWSTFLTESFGRRQQHTTTHTSKCYAATPCPEKWLMDRQGWLSMGWWMALNPLDDWLVVSTYPSEKYNRQWEGFNDYPIYHMEHIGKYKSHVT